MEKCNESLFFFLLDEFEDFYNLGFIMWIVDVVGVYGIIILKCCLVGLMVIVVKVFIGVIEYVFVVRVINLLRMIDELKDWGVWIVGIDVKESDDYCNLDGGMLFMLVIGSEGKGMSCLICEKCDFFV